MEVEAVEFAEGHGAERAEDIVGVDLVAGYVEV